jgi:drug/metabolite transporter (DMT)-like permease
MKPFNRSVFDRKHGEAVAPLASEDLSVIRTHMNRSDWGTMIVLALIWGGAFFFISVAVHAVPPLTYVWLRLTIAAAGMWMFLWVKGERIALGRGVWGSILVLAVLNNAIPFALIGWGETRMGSGLAAILNATTPIWGVLVAHFFTKDERMSPRKVGGVLLGVAGVAIMIGPSLLADIGGSALAQIACVAASLSYAVAAVWARRFRRMGLPPLTVTTGQLTAGALVMLPLAMVADRPWSVAVPGIGPIAAIVALALLCTAFAYILYFRLIDSAGATNALLVTLLVPPTAILLGALFLGETLAPQDVLGLLLIAFGLAAIDGRLISVLARARPRRAA